MNNELWQQAKKLASRLYDTYLEKDELSDGTPIFVAYNPELVGCKSQGKTRELALTNLGEARIDYIYSLLEDGLSVPQPNSLNTITGGLPNNTTNTYIREYIIELDTARDDISSEPAQPNNQVPLYQEAWAKA
jgi:predicted RNase H-like HicB family nuclease